MTNDLRHHIPRPHIDHAEIRRLHERALRTAANGKHPVLAELAREVLAGRLTVRAAAASSGYRDALAESADKFVQAIRHMSDDEIRAAVENGTFDEEVARRRPAPPDDTDESAAPTPKPDADAYFDQPIMESRTPAGREESPQRSRWTRRWT